MPLILYSLALLAGMLWPLVKELLPSRPKRRLTEAEKDALVEQATLELEAWNDRFNDVCSMLDIEDMDANAEAAIKAADGVKPGEVCPKCAIGRLADGKCSRCFFEEPPEGNYNADKNHCRGCGMVLVTKLSKSAGICNACRKANARAELERKRDDEGTIKEDRYYHEVRFKYDGKYVKLSTEEWKARGKPTAREVVTTWKYRYPKCQLCAREINSDHDKLCSECQSREWQRQRTIRALAEKIDSGSIILPRRINEDVKAKAAEIEREADAERWRVRSAFS